MIVDECRTPMLRNRVDEDQGLPIRRQPLVGKGMPTYTRWPERWSRREGIAGYLRALLGGLGNSAACEADRPESPQSVYRVAPRADRNSRSGARVPGSSVWSR